jgi:hypothetical protein
MPPALWTIPEGLRVDEDGTWRVGDLQVIHPPSLRYMKQHLVFEDGGAFVVDAGRRMPIELAGPPYVVTSLVLDAAGGTARAVLDDGSDEAIEDDTLGMNERTGRFECLVRGGAARAVLSRSAHQILLDHVEDRGAAFVLQVGRRSISIRT